VTIPVLSFILAPITALAILFSGDYTGADSTVSSLFAYEDSPAVTQLLDAHHALGLPTYRRSTP